jgi:hypothetical protein
MICAIMMRATPKLVLEGLIPTRHSSSAARARPSGNKADARRDRASTTERGAIPDAARSREQRRCLPFIVCAA